MTLKWKAICRFFFGLKSWKSKHTPHKTVCLSKLNTVDAKLKNLNFNLNFRLWTPFENAFRFFLNVCQLRKSFGAQCGRQWRARWIIEFSFSGTKHYTLCEAVTCRLNSTFEGIRYAHPTLEGTHCGHDKVGYLNERYSMKLFIWKKINFQLTKFTESTRSPKPAPTPLVTHWALSFYV